MKQNNPFELEKTRAELANKNNIKELVKTYQKNYPEIPDLNTAQKWDYLNIEARELLGKNPMEADRIRIVSALLKGKKKTVLNIGFGSASLEKYLAKTGKLQMYQWNGIDISSESVSSAKKALPTGTFSVGTILDIKSKANAFDYTIAMEVLEHIPPSSIFQALHEIHRVLKPGGYFICSVPLNEGLEEMIASGENPNAHVRVYTQTLIRKELEVAQFTVLKDFELYAFHQYYRLKTFLAKHLQKNKYSPNNIIILSQKPL
jgi:2-polyprenyl-3-methyl-5-hydroxy-6-metoxy-1,4-benzoquinol methylase